MSVSTARKVACDSTMVPGDMLGRSGLPGSSVTIGARARYRGRARSTRRSPSARCCVCRWSGRARSLRCRRSGSSAVVLPPLIRSRTSSIVRSSIQTLSCMSIGRGILVTSTRGCGVDRRHPAIALGALRCRRLRDAAEDPNTDRMIATTVDLIRISPPTPMRLHHVHVRATETETPRLGPRSRFETESLPGDSVQRNGRKNEFPKDFVKLIFPGRFIGRASQGDDSESPQGCFQRTGLCVSVSL